jgi:hypothetical protein
VAFSRFRAISFGLSSASMASVLIVHNGLRAFDSLAFWRRQDEFYELLKGWLFLFFTARQNDAQTEQDKISKLMDQKPKSLATSSLNALAKSIHLDLLGSF